MTWTISSILDWTTGYFEKNGIENPHLEAEILLSHSLGLKRIDLYVQHERVLKDDELATFKKLILRRAKKEPTAYITGKRSFMSLDFDVDSSVLIPRPETERLVEITIDAGKDIKKDRICILDIGTGSGAVSVSLAYYLKNSYITATDISKSAIETAARNAAKHCVSDRITFIHDNIFDSKYKGDKFDIIVSNPPYIPSGEIKNLQAEIANYEPVQALDGGADGMDFYRNIFAKTHVYLFPSGYLIIEAGIGQSSKIVKMIDDSVEFETPKVFEDHNGIERVIVSRKTGAEALSGTIQRT
ncbi:MAG: peptide chain release factor N(5)-glutamine methyltransferase [Candidatus Saganbacteria bacterium]|nr:peptide chain release factor N(5)-glutamine methyltransferase [Candidatus Saganbacteria bacterium]